MTRQPFGYSYKSDTIFRPDEPSAGGAVSMYGQGKMPNKSREGKVTLEIVRNGNKIKFKRIPYKGNEEGDSMITNNTTATATANNDFNAFKKGMQEMCINQVTEYLGLDKAIDCLIRASENKEDILNYLKEKFETEILLDVLMKEADPAKGKPTPDGRELINKIFNSGCTSYLFHSTVDDTEKLNNIIDEISPLHKGKGRYGVTCRRFFETLLNTIDPEGKIVKKTLQIMVDGYYHDGYGITLAKALPFVSVMVYHKDRLDDVARELNIYAKQHSFAALEIDANREIKFLDHLDITTKASLYLEQYVCNILEIPTEMVKRN